MALGLDQNTFNAPGYFDKATWLLGFTHYFKNLPSCVEKQEYGIRPHTDSGIFTLLASDGKPGLQVCLNEDVSDISNRIWVDINPPPTGHLIVNLGKNLAIWSGNRFKATLHRVLLDGKEDRYSVPFFYETNLDLEIKPLVNKRTQKDENDRAAEMKNSVTPADMFLERLDKNKSNSFK